MSDFATISFCGRITDDIKFFDAKPDQKIAKFGVALNLYTPKGDKVVFKEVIVFGPQVKYLTAVQANGSTKGATVFVSGTLDLDTYKDVTKEIVRATAIQILSKTPKAQSENAPPGSELPF